MKITEALTDQITAEVAMNKKAVAFRDAEKAYNEAHLRYVVCKDKVKAILKAEEDRLWKILDV
jgi:hypothetical protein